MRTTLILTLALAAPVLGDAGDDTLRFYLARSDLVVVGEIVAEHASLLTQAGVANYNCDVRVTEVLKGPKPAADPLRVTITRFELDDGDRLPELKKGGKFILFLKRADAGTTPEWQTADIWFGVQRPGPWMARAVKRLAAEEAARDK